MDTDWVLEAQRLANIQQICIPENMPNIHMQFIYVNKNKQVENIVKEIHPLSTNVIKKELLLEIIQKHKKNTTNTNYVLKDTFLFHIPIQPEILPKFIEPSFSCDHFMKYLPVLEDIEIPPSIFIFHQYNTLFFIYQEEEKRNIKLLKSALKSDNIERRITKRVRLKLPRNTRKQIPSLM